MEHSYKEKGALTIEELNKLEEQTKHQYEDLASQEVYDRQMKAMKEGAVKLYDPKNYFFYKTNDIANDRIWNAVYKIAPTFDAVYNYYRTNADVTYNNYIPTLMSLPTEYDQLIYLARLSDIASEHLLIINALKSVKEIVEYIEKL